MSATTKIAVTAIRIRTNTDTLFDGSDFDPALCDQDATRQAYLDELLAEVKASYPQAKVSVEDATVYRTEVSADTSHDNVRDDSGDTHTSVLEVEQDVANTVDDDAARVWERGTFWVEPQA